MGTNRVSLGSDLQRRKWLQDNLLRNKDSSFWSKFTGNNSNSIIYQENDSSCGSGHTVVFDYSAKLTGKATKGADIVYGKGEVKRKFSDKLTVEEYSLVVDNGSKFDACDVDDLAGSQHSDSVDLLGDLFTRWKDQMYFDVAQGAVGTKPSHIYFLGDQFRYNDLLYIEDAGKTGQNLKASTNQGGVDVNKSADIRSPLSAFRNTSKDTYYLCIVDSYMSLKLKADPKYQTLVSTGDVRGNDNRIIDMKLGKLGTVIYVEAGNFFGATSGNGKFGLEDTEVEFAGLRKYAIIKSSGKLVWEGQSDFYKVLNKDVEGDIYSRGLLMGGGALQGAFGKMPDYKLEFGKFKKTSESMMEFWCTAKKTILTLQNGKDFKNKVAEIDFSVVALDMKHTAT